MYTKFYIGFTNYHKSTHLGIIVYLNAVVFDGDAAAIPPTILQSGSGYLVNDDRRALNRIQLNLDAGFDAGLPGVITTSSGTSRLLNDSAARRRALRRSRSRRPIFGLLQNARPLDGAAGLLLICSW